MVAELPIQDADYSTQVMLNALRVSHETPLPTLQA